MEPARPQEERRQVEVEEPWEEADHGEALRRVSLPAHPESTKYTVCTWEIIIK